MSTNITINYVTTKSHLLLAEIEQSSITAYSPDTALWAVKQVPAAILYTGVSFCKTGQTLCTRLFVLPRLCHKNNMRAS